jgi:hypothetical protein
MKLVPTRFDLTKSVRIVTDGCTKFRKFLVEGTERVRSSSRSLWPVAGSC